ncbi:methyl-accepting chemotaxis protein [Aliikangiella coralliicola]|uniref:HAMP domain-containing protein n=1 Tax=Aliikangiella coralliicola TaxID=2592383 RepID=A0A545TW51_9GAMM|nr:methyl-accepting chemotaxis protein [Aliikangiella coralliicola]TQV81453.1 HAMP domain-containing protein [Aliikangiella coralliicola]
MNLTVTARIAGGSGLVIVLLIALTFTGLSGVSSIDEGLTAVTDKSTPMLIAGSENVSSLLKATVEVNRFHQSRVTSELTDFEANYQSLMKSNKSSGQSLALAAQQYPEVLSSLDESKKAIAQFSELVPQVFEKHRRDLSLGDNVSGMRGEFEDVADELDSLLYDFSEDLGSGDTASVLQSMSNMVREATVTVTDVLVSTDPTVVDSAIRDITALVKDFDGKFSQVKGNSQATNNDYYADTEAAINKFRKLTNDSGNILETYALQLDIRAQAKQQLVESDVSATDAQAHLNNVFSKVKGLTQSIKEDAGDKVSSSRTLLISFAVIAILVAAGVNYWVLQSVTSPLNEVLRVITKLSKGDLTEKVEVHSEDELGKLSNGFNDLIDALRSMLKEIGSSSEQLSASAEQTAAISSQSSQNINYQKEQTDMIATAMTEMTATVDEVANSANNTLLEVQKANKETVDGQSVVQDSISTINKLASEIESAAVVIDKLDQYSTNIGAVLDVIRGIADQTNLLALNAAIEAARAGEQGRGFAVVADEVRTLASKTQESTSEIQEMIERLQTGTREAVTVMESSRSEAQNSVEQTATAGETLGKITQAVSVINDMSTHIASAAEEQSSVSQEMHQNVSSISEMADSTAQGASENLEASQELARLAEHMQKLVSRFKY